MVVERVLRSLSQKFDFIVIAIQEAKDVKTMNTEELKSSLEAHELLVIDRSSERSVQQTLQAQTTKKEGNYKNSKKGKGKSNWSNNSRSKADNKTESSKRREVLGKIRTRRRILIRVRFSVIIVTSLDILLMSVGSRKIRIQKKPILLMEVTLMQCC